MPLPTSTLSLPDAKGEAAFGANVGAGFLLVARSPLTGSLAAGCAPAGAAAQRLEEHPLWVPEEHRGARLHSSCSPLGSLSFCFPFEVDLLFFSLLFSKIEKKSSLMGRNIDLQA